MWCQRFNCGPPLETSHPRSKTDCPNTTTLFSFRCDSAPTERSAHCKQFQLTVPGHGRHVSLHEGEEAIGRTGVSGTVADGTDPARLGTRQVPRLAGDVAANGQHVSVADDSGAARRNWVGAAHDYHTHYHHHHHHHHHQFNCHTYYM